MNVKLSLYGKYNEFAIPMKDRHDVTVLVPKWFTELARKLYENFPIKSLHEWEPIDFTFYQDAITKSGLGEYITCICPSCGCVHPYPALANYGWAARNNGICDECREKRRRYLDLPQYNGRRIRHRSRWGRAHPEWRYDKNRIDRCYAYSSGIVKEWFVLRGKHADARWWEAMARGWYVRPMLERLNRGPIWKIGGYKSVKELMKFSLQQLEQILVSTFIEENTHGGKPAEDWERDGLGHQVIRTIRFCTERSNRIQDGTGSESDRLLTDSDCIGAGEDVDATSGHVNTESVLRGINKREKKRGPSGLRYSREECPL